MRVSLNTVKHYIDFELPPVGYLVQRINQQLGGVESAEDLSEKYKDAIIVKVVECEKHPNADKLSVCKIDAGTGELIQVVCGAPNARAGIVAIWLPPESIVPASFDDKEPFKLDAREIRGILSHGMLAAADELAIGTDHTGIIEISENDLSGNQSIKPGDKFAEVFRLNDTALDIENKMFTHRPDCFGQIGVAREIAGIFGSKFNSPNWYLNQDLSKFSVSENKLNLDVFNDAPEKVKRFVMVALRDVQVKPSPLWLQTELVRLGSKSINNIVDITNYMMLLTGQPMHAYDYDKLAGGKIGARMAADGEKATFLNGKNYELSNEDIVIVDGDGVVGLGGIIGGLDSEVTLSTKNIVLECANFDMYAIRKTSMRYGLFTDAVTRFSKGQSTVQNNAITAQAIEMILDLADGEVASEVFDASEKPNDNPAIELSKEFINDRLGLDLGDEQIIDLLSNVEFEVSDNPLMVKAPFWRTDIELAEDIVEEVGRLYGFDKVPLEFPKRAAIATKRNKNREIAGLIRNALASSGANELLTYSFVHENIMKRAEQDISEAFKLGNALSPDLQYYRLSVLPSLLDKVHSNIKSGYDEFIIYEIGKGHNKKYHANDDDGLPGESMFLDGVYVSKRPKQGAAYYHMRRVVDELADSLGVEPIYKPINESLDFPVTAPFEQSRSALIETKDGNFIGIVGELKQSVQKNFKTPEYISAMSLDFAGLVKLASRKNYVTLPKFPYISQDITLKVPSKVACQDLAEASHQAIHQAASGGIDARLDFVGIFQPEGDKETKSITQHLEVASYEKTLTNEDVKIIVDRIVETAKEKFGAELS